MSQQQIQRDKLVYLRQWVGDRVSIVTANALNYKGILTNIVFDGTRLMYIMLDEKICINYDHVIEVRLER
jgi:RNase P/RNase MRP subunit p29